jgi:hypothetical protein
MDMPEVLGLNKLEKTVSTMEHSTMGETLRPRRTSAWAYRRQKIRISNSFGR